MNEHDKSPIYCEHANEMPSICPCNDDCYCKENACKSQRRVESEDICVGDLKLDQVQKLWDFVVEISVDSHDDICPLNHPAYRNKWCKCCEAKKLVKHIREER